MVAYLRWAGLSLGLGLGLASRRNRRRVAAGCAAAALAATAVESIPIAEIDNVTVPIAAGLVARRFFSAAT